LQAAGPYGFDHLNFEPLDLFRILDFVLRNFNLSDAADLNTSENAR